MRIPSHQYILVNISVLCNCDIKAENNFLLESFAACHDVNSKLIMYFMVNTAFVNYLDQMGNLTETLDVSILLNKTTILLNKTTLQQILSISLNISKFDMDLLTAPKTLKDFIHHYKCKKQNFDFDKRHASTDTNLPNKNFFSDNFILNVFLFVSVVISVLVTLLAIHLLCKHMKLRTLVTSLALQQIKEVGAVTIQKDVIMNTCKIQYYTILALNITI